jgi:hypothetical protein
MKTLGAAVKFVSFLFDSGANVTVLMTELNDMLTDAVKSLLSVNGFHDGSGVNGEGGPMGSASVVVCGIGTALVGCPWLCGAPVVAPPVRRNPSNRPLAHPVGAPYL